MHGCVCIDSMFASYLRPVRGCVVVLSFFGVRPDLGLRNLLSLVQSVLVYFTQQVCTVLVHVPSNINCQLEIPLHNTSCVFAHHHIEFVK